MEKLLKYSAYFALFAGTILVIGGVWGICFTYKNITEENIITSSDASIPNTPVRGPFTLHSQAEIIREHTLKTTGGKTYAEMPRTVEKLDEKGQAVLDSFGKPVMIPNEARDMWVTATTLTTALHLGILTYVFSGLIVLFGLISIWTGIVFFKMGRL